MQEYIIKGTIITETMGISSIEAGTLCLLEKDEQFYCITIQHIDTKGDWYVEGDYTGTISRLKKLFKIAILTAEGSYPIAIKDWVKVIKRKLFGHTVTAILKPYPFKEGKYVQTCTECTCSFIASKSQPFCKNCCEEMSTALIKETEEPAISINKRPRLISQTKWTTICMDAYHLLNDKYLSEDEYKEWLNKQIQDANNND
jgi:hypothetical protein